MSAESGDGLESGSLGGRVDGLLTPVVARGQLLVQFRDLLATGKLRPGDRLPNERRIAEESGLSRSTVRSVLSDLERDGHLSRHVGRGTYVMLATPSGNMLDGANPFLSPRELMEFRAAVEPTLVDMIVLNATDAQLGQLVDELALGRNVKRWREAEAADRQFHENLFRATNNSLFIQVAERVSQVRAEDAWMKIKERSFSCEQWPMYQREHEQIAEALSHRDAAQAGVALRDHLLGVRRHTKAAGGDI